MRSRPDVLVLGAGGVLGEAWMMGVLAGIEDAAGFDLRRCDYFVGTSAGAIVAAHLVAGRPPVRPSAIGEQLEPVAARPGEGLAAAARLAARRAGGLALATGAMFAPLAVEIGTPGAALVRGMVLRTVPRASSTLDELRGEVERLGARFDGRLRIAAVDRRSGRRVVFGAPGSPEARVPDAVAASCSVPWLFEPVEIGGREYVDGGLWSPTNLDAAPAGRDAQVLCLNPAASLPVTHSVLALIRTAARSAVSLESLVLRRRGAVVQTVAPSAESAAAIGTNYMDRAPRERVLAAGYRQGLAVAQRAAEGA